MQRAARALSPTLATGIRGEAATRAMSRVVATVAAGACLLTGASGVYLRAPEDPSAERSDPPFHMALNPVSQKLADSITERIEARLKEDVVSRADAMDTLDRRMLDLERKHKEAALAYESGMTGSAAWPQLDAYEQTLKRVNEAAKEQLEPSSKPQKAASAN